MGPAFSNLNNVSNTAQIMLVMNGQFHSAPDVLVVLRMPDLIINRHLYTLIAAMVRYDAGDSFEFLILHFYFSVLTTTYEQALMMPGELLS